MCNRNTKRIRRERTKAFETMMIISQLMSDTKPCIYLGKLKRTLSRINANAYRFQTTEEKGGQKALKAVAGN